MWQPTERSNAAQQIYAAAEQDRAQRPDRYHLDPESVLGRATKNFASSEFSSNWRSGLESFLASAEHDGRLNAVGVRMAQQMATGRLIAGAEVTRYLKEHPEVADTRLAPPIVIVGGWRTGTTFLFRLLAGDPRLHAPLPAELVAPWLFAGNRAGVDQLTAPASQLLHTLNPDMAFIHPSGPTLPEECVLGMGTDLRNWGFTSMLRIPTYADWLAAQDFTATYGNYRTALQMLATDDPRRFVLKAPAHTAELDHLVATFPGAVVVQIHRDIVPTLTSGASLFAVYRSTYSDAVDPAEVGREQVRQSELWFRRAAEFRASPASAAARFVDVDYEAFVARPADTLAAVYRAANMEPPGDPDEFVAAYQRAHSRTAHRQHRYTPEEFGIDPGDLGERFSFLERAQTT
jgi:hypothetical protein